MNAATPEKNQIPRTNGTAWLSERFSFSSIISDVPLILKSLKASIKGLKVILIPIPHNIVHVNNKTLIINQSDLNGKLIVKELTQRTSKIIINTIRK